MNSTAMRVTQVQLSTVDAYVGDAMVDYGDEYDILYSRIVARDIEGMVEYIGVKVVDVEGELWHTADRLAELFECMVDESEELADLTNRLMVVGYGVVEATRYATDEVYSKVAMEITKMKVAMSLLQGV